MIKGIAGGGVMPAKQTDKKVHNGLGERKCVAQSTPQNPSVLQNKNFVPERRRTHSKKAVELDDIRNIARGMLAAGQPVSETRLFEIIGTANSPKYRSWRYRADILRAMKQLRNYYPNGLQLVLEHSEWYLIPVGSGGEP